MKKQTVFLATRVDGELYRKFRKFLRVNKIQDRSKGVRELINKGLSDNEQRTASVHTG
jgi:hypothetical protein